MPYQPKHSPTYDCINGRGPMSHLFCKKILAMCIYHALHGMKTDARQTRSFTLTQTLSQLYAEQR